MKAYLEKLYQHQKLDQQEAYDALSKIATNEANTSQIASFITVFLMRGISVEELKGFSDALMQLCIPVTFDRDVMDVCGTGGDGKNTFNISTLSAFVVAASGIPVAKHGNYGVSSVSGSSNVLEYLGYQFTSDINKLKQQVDRCGITFMHAPLFHPTLKHAAPIRKELGIKTFFNMLGPLINPANPKYRMIGVYNAEIGRVYHYLLQQKKNPFAVVYSLDGYDEISTTSDFKLYTEKGEQQVSMRDLRITTCDALDLRGGESVKEAADIFLQVIKGNGTDAQTNAVSVNAGIAIESSTGKNRLECIALAKENLLSGKVYKVFNQILKS